MEMLRSKNRAMVCRGSQICCIGAVPLYVVFPSPGRAEKAALSLTPEVEALSPFKSR